MANWKHGRYSATEIERNRELRKMLRQMRIDHRRLLEEMNGSLNNFG
jgi:cell division septum initiation protein DivIVA